MNFRAIKKATTRPKEVALQAEICFIALILPKTRGHFNV